MLKLVNRGIEVHAAGSLPYRLENQRRVYMQMAKLKFPATLGRDFSGVVAEVGAGVSDFKKGDEVYGYARVLSGKTTGRGSSHICKMDTHGVRLS